MTSSTIGIAGRDVTEIIASSDGAATERIATGAETDMSAEPAVDLQLQVQTIQEHGTDCCWLLAVVESLRHSGWLEVVLQTGVTLALSGNIVEWSTFAGKRGSLELATDDLASPVWQQVLESIFMLLHPSEAKKGLRFQESVRPAMGMGMQGRADAIQAYFHLVSPQLEFSAKLLTPRPGLVQDDAAKFFAVKPGIGEAVVFTIQILGLEKPHAIAVHAVEPADGCLWKMLTYDELYRRFGRYDLKIGKRSAHLPQCADGTTCDGIVRFSVRGLSSEVDKVAVTGQPSH